MNQQEIKNYENLKKNPSKLNQGVHGCCAFAAVLMHALGHYNIKSKQLCDTVFDGKKFGDIVESVKVKNRLAKRDNVMQQPLTFDAKLCIGLMIIFKEYLKQNPNNIKQKMWELCVNYSTLFDGWDYGEKLKIGNSISDFSYKNGDIALTFGACQELLQFFTGVNSVREAILDDDDFIHSRNISTKIKQSADNLKRDFLANKYKGAILGMSSPDWRNKKQYQKHGFIAHWVYISKDQSKAKVNEILVWTWGKESKYDINNPNKLSGEDLIAKFLLKF